jgi:carbonic anhydrase
MFMIQEINSRRSFFRSACCGSLGLAASIAAPQVFAADTPKTLLTADQALATLKEGNAKFLTDSPLRAVQGRARRLEIARGQAPFAVLVSCSDSRVPPEVLFGRGLGELFIVRNAGNTVDTVALGSIEYAIAVLGVPLIVVLGHERCGAVDAALSVVEKNTVFPGSLNQMIEPILPAALMARSTGAKGEALLDAAVRENIRRVVTRIKNSEPVLMNPIKSGKVKVVGARYDLDDGDVDFFV